MLLTDEIEYRYIYPKDRLQDPDDTKFLQDRCSQLIQGLNAIGITTALQMQLFQAIAGIILLGNIQFRPIDQNVKKGVSLDSVECCVDEDDPILQNIASLLGKDDIANIFTAKVIQGQSFPSLLGDV